MLSFLEQVLHAILSFFACVLDALCLVAFSAGVLDALCPVIFRVFIFLHLVLSFCRSGTYCLLSLQVVSRRDLPLLKFMSTMAAALGMEGIFCMGETVLPSPDGVKHEGHVPGGSSHETVSGGNAAELVPVGGIEGPRSAWESGVAIQGVLSRGAATEFYQNFLVPRLLATAGGGGRGEAAAGGTAAAESAVVCKTLAERFLLAGSGESGYLTQTP